MWYNNHKSDNGFEANLELSYICMLVSIASISFRWVQWTEFIFTRTSVIQDLRSRETDWKVTPFCINFWQGLFLERVIQHP